MLIVGLTGGIATGKSVIACQMAKVEGVKVIELDELAWETYKFGTPVYQKLVDHFGPRILKPDKSISRGKLGEIVFNNKEELKFLDRTVHPKVTERLNEIIEEERKQKTKVLIVVAALLLEAKSLNQDIFDYIIVANLEEEKRIKRLMNRDNLSKEEALKRINAQPGQESKLERADLVIETSGPLEETKRKARELIDSLLSKEKVEDE